MASPDAERAIEDALTYGKALLKYITANEVGLTGSHQRGYYLPDSPDVWPLFTPQAPIKGVLDSHPVKVTWPDGTVTDSEIKWYGRETRSEYRLTSFNRIRGFPYLSEEVLGDLLILIPVEEQQTFHAYVIDLADDIEEICAELGISLGEKWALYERGAAQETQIECIERNFQDFVEPLDEFPKGDEFSEATWEVLEECRPDVKEMSLDEALLVGYNMEFELFKRVEQKLCEEEIRSFKTVDEFISKAKSLTQRRKSRAGRSLENHVSHLLSQEGIDHEMRPAIQGQPDVVVPSAEAYEDKEFPDEKLFLIACKTTFKDRWAQVVKEGKRVPQKHLFTLQKGMAPSQLKELDDANVNLVVPKEYHDGYPKSPRIITVEEFFERLKAAKETVTEN